MITTFSAILTATSYLKTCLTVTPAIVTYEVHIFFAFTIHVSRALTFCICHESFTHTICQLFQVLWTSSSLPTSILAWGKLFSFRDSRQLTVTQYLVALSSLRNTKTHSRTTPPKEYFLKHQTSALSFHSYANFWQEISAVFHHKRKFWWLWWCHDDTTWLVHVIAEHQVHMTLTVCAAVPWRWPHQAGLSRDQVSYDWRHKGPHKLIPGAFGNNTARICAMRQWF